MPRLRKPVELHKRDGTYQKCRHEGNFPEMPEQNIYPAPVHLEGIAREAWNIYEPMLRESRVLKSTDLIALESYCIAYALFVAAQKEVNEYGPTMEDDKGKTYKNPSVTVQTEASKELRALSTVLGLDPAARTRINVDEKDKAPNGFDALRPVRSVK